MTAKQVKAKARGGTVPAGGTARGVGKTVLKSLAQCSFGQHGDPASVDVKGSRILRM